MILAGDTVSAQGDRNEQIVGHVLRRIDDQSMEVLWLSTERGAFTCVEEEEDVNYHKVEPPRPTGGSRYISVSIAAVAD